MSLITYQPPTPLYDYIHLFWSCHNYAPPHPKERILPFGMMELTINFEHPFVMMYPHDQFHPHCIGNMIVGGARSDYFVVDTSRPASLLSVWFKAGGALAFFGASASELHNVHIPLSDLWGRKADELYMRLCEASTPHERFRILEICLLERLYRAKIRHRAIDFALQLFEHTDSMNRVVEKIALSPTRFIQVFKEEIGVSPKLFCQIQRFQRATRLIAHSPHPNWVDIALSCGYYDQAHFINAFQRFAGITPTLYIPQDKDHASNLAMG